VIFSVIILYNSAWQREKTAPQKEWAAAAIYPGYKTNDSKKLRDIGTIP
jgi:hypothetical protein